MKIGRNVTERDQLLILHLHNQSKFWSHSMHILHTLCLFLIDNLSDNNRVQIDSRSTIFYVFVKPKKKVILLILRISQHLHLNF